MSEPDTVKQVSQEIVQFCGSIPATIGSQAEYDAGVTMVVDVTKELKRRKAWFVEFLAPAKTVKDAAARSLKDQEAMRDLSLSPLMRADEQLRSSLLQWKRQDDQRIRQEQERQNKLYKGRVAKAEAKGKDADTVKPPPVMGMPKATTKTVGGSFGVRSNKVLVIVDEAIIPEHYFDRIRNDKRIETVLRQNLDVPGAMLKEEMTSSVRTG